MPEPGRKRSRPEQPLNLESLMGNKPPQALDVEEAVLGAMLVEPATIDESMEELTPSCFYDPQHRMIFEAMSALVNEHAGRPRTSSTTSKSSSRRPSSGT